MILRFVEKMIGILYIILIVGWIILVIALKCKRIHQRQPPCDPSTNQPIHVIQIDPSIYESVRSNHSQHSWRTIAAHTNQAYLPDEPMYSPPPNVFAPPPSYEEVMRATHIYPKREPIPGSISTGSFKPHGTDENDQIETISTGNGEYSCSSSRASSSGASASTSTITINHGSHSAASHH